MYQESDVIQQILNSARTIAVVGLSSEPRKPSHYVSAYMQAVGYRIIPIHPRATELLGEKVYPNLASIPEPVDLVNVFRPSSECAAIIEQAIAIKAKAVWTQLGITCPEAAQKAQAAGLLVVMDRCLKIEHARLAR
jgi:predicted CoA-binding protein